MASCAHCAAPSHPLITAGFHHCDINTPQKVLYGTSFLRVARIFLSFGIRELTRFSSKKSSSPFGNEPLSLFNKLQRSSLLGFAITPIPKRLQSLSDKSPKEYCPEQTEGSEILISTDIKKHYDEQAA